MHLHLEDAEPLRVQYLEPFFDSFVALHDSPETFRAFVELLDQAILQGDAVPTLENSKMRVLRTAADSGLPPLRLFFFIEHGTMKFMFVAHYQEDEP
ncbi:MAG TPA: hypothetical protein VKB93_15310 [Thermoanaerobaculia bacterium]|nr:hypothetical protein [Thermoanaerobaculia bacterium]